MKKGQSRNIAFIIVVLLFISGVFLLTNPRDKVEEITISAVFEKVEEDEINKLIIDGDQILAFKDEAAEADDTPDFKATKEPGLVLNEELRERELNDEVTIDAKPIDSSNEFWLQLAFTVGPLVVIIGFFWFMMRQAQGQGNQAMNFGKSRAKIYGSDKKKVKFDDIAGNAEAKQDLEEVVEFLRFPKKFENVGAKIPKGVLLVGAPGTGKTLIARAVAGEAGTPFFTISGSEFVEMFVGVGASRVRDLFNKAKKNAPCIIFIDEIDAVGRRRGSGMGGGHDEREQTLNQILVEMDGFEQGTNVIVIAATNRQDVLDPALLRPGRFDRRVNITLPDRKEREAILKIHLKDKPVADDVDIDALAAKTAGTSGADLANIANEAAIVTARRNKKVIGNDELTEAFEKVAIGPERKSKVMTGKEKEITAIHESGHALVGHVLPLSDPIHKVTIIPRGGTGGVTWAIPPEDKSYHSINEYKDVLARILGGRMAEKVFYGDDNVTTGAGNDLQKAHELAREMVIEQGMGSKLRHQVFNAEHSGMMFDRMVQDRPYSEETAKEIDDEVELFILEAAKRAEKVIRANKSYLRKLADQLLEVETIDADQVSKTFKGSKMPSAAKL